MSMFYFIRQAALIFPDERNVVGGKVVWLVQFIVITKNVIQII
jgi:hypothetical protein